MQSKFVALQKICKKWGGSLQLMSKDEFKTKVENTATGLPNGWSVAPFTIKHDLAVHWQRKTIVATDANDWPMLIHEIGHVFACKEIPWHAQEWPWLGWEFRLAKLINGAKEWYKAQKEYVIDWPDPDGKNHVNDFGDCTPRQRKLLLAERVVAAHKAGLLNSKLEPIAIR